MTSDRHDSVLISIDWISFRYFFRRNFRAYLLVITADTNGNLEVYESPEIYSILHRPIRDKPATIDFGFDGFVIYSSTGNVPDLVRFDVFVVKDRSKGRKVGALRQMLRDSSDFESALATAKDAVGSSSNGAAASSVATAVTPVLDLVGGMVERMDDKVIEAYSGSKIFDVAMVRWSEDEPRKRLDQSIVSPTGNIETKVDITLFQRQSDPSGETETTDTPEDPTDGPDAPPVDAPPPVVTSTEPRRIADEPITEPEKVAVSLRRPRILFRTGWIMAASVIPFIALAAAVDESSSDAAVAFLILAALALIVSPGFIYGAGRWARARLNKKGLTRLGWVAVVFHLVSLGVIGLGGVILASAFTISVVQQGASSIGEAIGQIFAQFIAMIFVAALGLTIMFFFSLFPALISVITALVFGRRETR
ncbi:MAG: hypothetical protein AAF799_08480 [Myxococcota bacterium]